MKKTVEWAVLGIAILVFVLVGWIKLPVLFYNRGNEYFEKKEYARARASFQKSISFNPSIAVVQYSLGNTYQCLGDEPLAVVHLKKAVELDPRFLPAYRLLITIYSNQARYDDALVLLDAVRNAGPGTPELESLTGSLRFEYMAFELGAATDAWVSGDRTQAYEHVRKAISLKDDYPYAHYTLGFFLYSDNKYEDAQRSLLYAISLDPDMWLAQRIMGDIAFERAAYQTAVTYYQSALSVWQESAAVFNNLGLSYMNLERYEEAIEPLRNAVRLEPGNTSIRYSLASVYRDSGRPAEALREYAYVVQEAPDFPNVHNDIGAIYEDLGRIADARKEYAQEIENAQLYLRVNAQDPVILTSLAYAYCGSGLFDKARASAEQALRAAPDYREAYLALARIYSKANRPAEALAAFEKAKILTKHAGFITAQIKIMQRGQADIKAAQASRPTHLIILKNGGKLRGSIKEEFPDRILFETQVGNSRGVLTLYRNTIEKISPIE